LFNAVVAWLQQHVTLVARLVVQACLHVLQLLHLLLQSRTLLATQFFTTAALLLLADVTHRQLQMDANALHIKISTTGNRIRCDSVSSDIAGCKHMFDQDPCAVVVDTDSMVGGSSSCPYADAHISSLKDQLLDAHSKRLKAQQQLQQWTGNTTLHPAFLGVWLRVEDQLEMIITANTVTFPSCKDGGPYMINRLAPYVFTSKRTLKGGNALYTLLPSLNQLIKVNYDCDANSSFGRMWVKNK
jgi:hypothetical protein